MLDNSREHTWRFIRDFLSDGDILNLLHRMSFLAFQMDAGLGKFPYTLAKQLLGFGMVFLLLGFRGTAIFPRFVNLDLNCADRKSVV